MRPWIRQDFDPSRVLSHVNYDGKQPKLEERPASIFDYSIAGYVSERLLYCAATTNYYTKERKMIKGILIINNHGKPRLVKFYQCKFSVSPFD